MNPLQKMRLMVARGVVRLIQDAGLQLVQADLLDEETRDGVERIQNYGHRGHPPQGSAVAAVAVAGSRDHLVVVACEHPDYVPPLESGETAMYAMFGQLFKMDKDGNVTLTCKNFTVNADGNIVQTATGNAQTTAGGNLGMNAGGGMSMEGAGGATLKGGLKADEIIADKVVGGGVDLETHKHPETNGSQTEIPVK
ncbi:phage baseplate assembly protein V [Neisseria leonii]|uniref:Phage baseplate assembly protein V n=1 Tax=Neisseria leonii TaxID=2995413 RepID=A0A9X4E2S8_9NEIS|nr:MULTISPECIES: phage baseplate assembly protein V [unclassified Neisseria]MDD9324743.1 phage baseplate assembly protein V [Neisseria sp. 3986]MDD9327694.1 phage baseplate assembly protein V [Neisseria sp. 51.81]